jgi:hypothetical protein
MKAKILKTSQRYDLINDTGLGIQAYAHGNDYPQTVMEIVDASGTGLSCVGVYAKFIAGKGFTNNNLYQTIINQKEQTANYLLNQIAADYALFGGFAIHVNYNANYRITELQHVPLESIRFEKLGDDNQFARVALHPDWGRRYLNLRRWRREDIRFIDLYNPDPEQIQAQVEAAGGWKNYRGQIYYHSNQGEMVYPKPIFDPVLTDMNTEEGIANVSNRNARNNFLAAGMLIDKANKDQSDEQENDTEKALKQFQGDEKACKIIYVQVEGEEDKPEFVSFKGTNYDKEFNVTLASSQSNIGKAFNQPPILRAENVGSNFGADLMKNAYNYYNSVIESERLVIQRTFATLLAHWHQPTPTDCSITPLTYEVEVSLADRIGKDNLTQLVSILNNTNISPEQKKTYCTTLFGLTPEQAAQMFATPTQP